MTVCHTDGCPASRDRDEFERPVSVQHGSITQSVLGATGHHLLNRQQDGTIEQHLRSWARDDLRRAENGVHAEILRASAYYRALGETQAAIDRETWGRESPDTGGNGR